MSNISKEALSILTQSSVCSQTNTVTLPTGELQRKIYEEVDDVLTRIGGKWNRKQKAHLFPYNPAPLFYAVIASRELPPKNPTAFFPTPDSVVRSMVEASGIMPYYTGLKILEPSAGTGAIAKYLRGYSESNDWQIDCCEVLPVNKQALVNEGFTIVAEDCLQHKPNFLYDAVLMNPPFGIDGNPTVYIDHIYHAWSLLKPNGHFAAIVPTGWITASNNKKVKAFRDFVANNLSYEEIGTGAFKDSGTIVNTGLIYGERSDNWRTKPYNGWNSYHAWNTCLWIDNVQSLYFTAIKQQSLADFTKWIPEVERELWRENIPVALTEDDVKAIWNYYALQD